MDKKALRSALREKISSLDSEYRENSDKKIFENIIAMPEYGRAKTVFAYFSVRGEADTHRLIEYSLELGKRVALPIVQGEGKMLFALAQDELASGALGIPEPDENSTKVTPEDGDIIIVPALCFDREGYRLGQGGGYYDRYLEKYGSVVSVGLCREELLMDAVPREGHDRRVDIIVTEEDVKKI